MYEKEREKAKQRKNGRVLSVQNLSVEYKVGREIVKAVNDVSFNLNYGQTLGLVGETGAGKTTVAKSIIRVLPTPPARITGGTVQLDDQNILALSDEAMRSVRGYRISMIFQDPMTALNPSIRVGKQIAEAIQIHEGLKGQEADEKAKHVLEMVGISRDRFREYPHQFSGGMKQRVIIAIALACSPDLIIADEPTTALDVTIQAQVLDLIIRLQKMQNTAMIMITHDFGIVARTCDYVAVMYGGQIIEYGNKQQIFKEPKHPYTQGLFDAIPKMNVDVERLTPIDGLPTDPTRLPDGCYFYPRCKYADSKCEHTPVPSVDIGDGHLCRCLRYANASQDRK
ncbi:MAG: ABC transporter ATP-binding protein [Clostridia bacterium]|nr:ABC transporter ATP-binding protein [Clostridia bacterium]